MYVPTQIPRTMAELYSPLADTQRRVHGFFYGNFCESSLPPMTTRLLISYNSHRKNNTHLESGINIKRLLYFRSDKYGLLEGFTSTLLLHCDGVQACYRYFTVAFTITCTAAVAVSRTVTLLPLLSWVLVRLDLRLLYGYLHGYAVAVACAVTSTVTCMITFTVTCTDTLLLLLSQLLVRLLLRLLLRLLVQLRCYCYFKGYSYDYFYGYFTVTFTVHCIRGYSFYPCS